MGMFDSLSVKCPACGENIQFQTKAGPCELANFHPSHVPVVVAHDLDGRVEQCHGCQQYVTVRIPGGVPNTVAMIVEMT